MSFENIISIIIIIIIIMDNKDPVFTGKAGYPEIFAG